MAKLNSLRQRLLTCEGDGAGGIPKVHVDFVMKLHKIFDEAKGVCTWLCIEVAGLICSIVCTTALKSGQNSPQILCNCRCSLIAGVQPASGRANLLCDLKNGTCCCCSGHMQWWQGAACCGCKAPISWSDADLSYWSPSNQRLNIQNA